jgi:hypothetical protein
MFTIILALAGMGDAPILLLLIPLALFPFHIAASIGVGDGLMGYSRITIAIQFASIATLILFPMLSRKWRSMRTAPKVIYFIIGYPIVIFSTNFIPHYLNIK